MSENLENICEQLLTVAKKNGADSAESLVIKSSSKMVEVKGLELEKAESSEDVDIGLRVFLGDKSSCVSASSTNLNTIEEVVVRAIAMAKQAPPDELSGLAESGYLATNWNSDDLLLNDLRFEDTKPSLLKTLALETENAALKIKGISQCEGAGANSNFSMFHFMTTNGFSGGYKNTSYQLFCSAIAGTGLSMERDFYGESRAFFDDLTLPSEIGTKAAVRAIDRLGSKQPPTGKFPVVFDERISSSLVSHVISAINGANVIRGSSWLTEKMNAQIFPKNIDLIETPFRKKILGSRPFDGEGLPKKTFKFIKNGELKNWLLDMRSARKLKLTPTGNATRSISGPPFPSIANLELKGGTGNLIDLLKNMGTGILVTSLIGSTVNPITGDYSRGATGFWVENGEICYPINEFTIAGNLTEMCSSVVLADDARTDLSTVVPSLLIEGLTTAGN